MTPADYTVKLQVDLVSVPPSWIGEDGTINKTFTIGIDSLETRISPSGRFRPITTTVRVMIPSRPWAQSHDERPLFSMNRYR